MLVLPEGVAVIGREKRLDRLDKDVGIENSRDFGVSYLADWPETAGRTDKRPLLGAVG
jgi:hypothetical protein